MSAIDDIIFLENKVKQLTFKQKRFYNNNAKKLMLECDTFDWLREDTILQISNLAYENTLSIIKRRGFYERIFN